MKSFWLLVLGVGACSWAPYSDVVLTCAPDSFADLDNDGRPDLIGRSCIAFANSISDGLTLPGANGLIPGDFDADNDVDLVSLNFNGGLLIFENENNSFNSRVLPPPRTGIELRLGDDFNGDGQLDLVAESTIDPGYFTLFLRRSGGFNAVSLGGIFSQMSSVDIDQDGDLDLVALSSNGVEAFLQQSEDSFERVSLLKNSLRQFSLSDVDNDGDTDLVGTGRDSMRVFINEGELQFRATEWSHLLYGDNTTALATGDIDQDGFPEIALHRAGGSFGDNQLIIFKNNLGISFEERVYVELPETGDTGVFITPIDNDESLDIFLSNPSVLISGANIVF